jgi:hypothetical protein
MRLTWLLLVACGSSSVAPSAPSADTPREGVAGMIQLAPGQHVPDGAGIFVALRRADGKAPVAVDKLAWHDGGVPFVLDASKRMIDDDRGPFRGPVDVVARYAQSGDLDVKADGDLRAEVRVDAPAGGVTLVLDR